MNTTPPIYTFDIEKLSAFYNIPKDELIQKPILEIQNLNDKMLNAYKQSNIDEKINNPEYQRIIKKYLSIYPMLSRYWSEKDILIACAKHVNITDITQNDAIPCNRIHCNPEDYNYYKQPAEYLETKVAIVPRYTKQGEQLLYGESKQCFVYRVPNQYQGLKHGNIILELLYQTYPELKEFDFKAYEYRYYEKSAYEIYPTNNIYTPLDSLLTKDIDAIIERNEKYCQIYNHGIYSSQSLQERLKSDEVKHYFDVIKNLTPIKKEDSQNV